MDDTKKKTLELILANTHRMDVVERGNQLVAVARDYVIDGQRMKGVEVLRQIEAEYFEKNIVAESLRNKAIADAVADLCFEFEIVDLLMIARKPKGDA